MIEKLTSLSSAKVNLGLQVRNKREDHYHNIHSIFVEVNLFDTLSFTPSKNYSLTFESDYDINLPIDENNLITKAYNLLKSNINDFAVDYKIHLNKKIPLYSGLGGGSSNAATTLKSLNKLWKLNFNNSQLEKIGKSLGADIPFFINGGVQLVEGIGDILIPLNIKILQDIQILMVIPSIQISTKWAYGLLNKSLQSSVGRTKFAPLSKPMNWELFENDFERVIHETYPEIREIKSKLYKKGALYAGLSGSGSTVFGVFDNHQKAKFILKEFNQYQTFLASPVFH